MPSPCSDGLSLVYPCDVSRLQAELLRLIEKEGVPAPAPIEQRWTSSSSANMSPAHDEASVQTVSGYFSSAYKALPTKTLEEGTAVRVLKKKKSWSFYSSRHFLIRLVFMKAQISFFLR